MNRAWGQSMGSEHGVRAWGQSMASEHGVKVLDQHIQGSEYLTYHGVSFVVRNYYRNATTRSTKRPQVARLLTRAEGGQIAVTALKFCGTNVRHACPRMSVATAAATQPAPSIPLPHRALASFDTTRFVEGNRGVPALVAHYPCRRLVRRAARVLAICRPRGRDSIRGARDRAARCDRADRWYRAGCRHACGAYGAYG